MMPKHLSALILALFVAFANAGMSISIFSDLQTVNGNTISTWQQITPPAPHEVMTCRVKRNHETELNINLANIVSGTLNVAISNLSGNQNLCEAIDLTADIDGGSVYSGKLAALTASSTLNQSNSSLLLSFGWPQHSPPVTQEKTCSFNLNISGSVERNIPLILKATGEPGCDFESLDDESNAESLPSATGMGTIMESEPTTTAAQIVEEATSTPQPTATAPPSESPAIIPEEQPASTSSDLNATEMAPAPVVTPTQPDNAEPTSTPP